MTPNAAPEFRTIRTLLLGYLLAGAVALVGAVVMRNHADQINSTVWIRAVVVLISAPVFLAITARAARGSAGAFRRLRIVSIFVAVAIAVIVAVPGMLPLWMRLDQAVCGLLMVGVAVLANRPALRQMTPSKP